MSSSDLPASVSHYLKSRPVHGLQCFRYLLPVCRGRAYSATIKCDPPRPNPFSLKWILLFSFIQPDLISDDVYTQRHVIAITHMACLARHLLS